MRALLALVILSAPAPAFADAISHPPDDCAEGSEGVRCHGAPTCRPLACTTDAECGEGKACQERSLCIERHCCGGRSCYTTSGRNEAAFADHVASACAGGACTSGSCESRRVCVPAEEPDEPAMNEPAMNEPTSMETSTQTQTEDTEDESCSTSSTAAGSIVLTALVALAIAIRRRK